MPKRIAYHRQLYGIECIKSTPLKRSLICLLLKEKKKNPKQFTLNVFNAIFLFITLHILRVIKIKIFLKGKKNL